MRNVSCRLKYLNTGSRVLSAFGEVEEPWEGGALLGEGNH